VGRKDGVLLVGRALSIIYCVFAAYETTYLPERLYSFLHYAGALRGLARLLMGSIFQPCLPSLLDFYLCA
jgi:hypothetical protein